jgi:hypothetical protein
MPLMTLSKELSERGLAGLEFAGGSRPRLVARVG